MGWTHVIGSHLVAFSASTKPWARRQTTNGQAHLLRGHGGADYISSHAQSPSRESAWPWLILYAAHRVHLFSKQALALDLPPWVAVGARVLPSAREERTMYAHKMMSVRAVWWDVDYLNAAALGFVVRRALGLSAGPSWRLRWPFRAGGSANRGDETVQGQTQRACETSTP